MTDNPAETPSEPVLPGAPEINFDVDSKGLRLVRGNVIRAIYRFVPTRALAGPHVMAPIVPFRDHWPDYMASTLALYVSVPEAVSSVPYFNEPISEGTHARLFAQSRDVGGHQATYNNWPLYLCTLDSTDQPDGILPGLFEPVYVSLTPLPEPEDPGHLYPPRISGP